MTNNNDKLKKAFSESLELEPEEVTDALSYGSVKWDSLGHMVLITAIEDQFDIMIDTKDVIDLSSYAKAKEIVRKYGIDV